MVDIYWVVLRNLKKVTHLRYFSSDRKKLYWETMDGCVKLCRFCFRQLGILHCPILFSNQRQKRSGWSPRLPAFPRLIWDKFTRCQSGWTGQQWSAIKTLILSLETSWTSRHPVPPALQERDRRGTGLSQCCILAGWLVGIVSSVERQRRGEERGSLIFSWEMQQILCWADRIKDTE